MYRDTLTTQGYAIAASVLKSDRVQTLVAAFEDVCSRQAETPRYSLRNVFTEVPASQQVLSDAGVTALVHDALGSHAFCVRVLYFDKIPGRNWPVAWHQDTTIAVGEKVETPGYEPWSVKAGVPHVRPPAEVLAGMVTLRIHLDDCPAANGALRVCPGSHRLGLLEADTITATRERLGEITCEAHAGDILLMKPLLLHASSPADQPTHRRVLHLEFASKPLPRPLQWHSQYPLDA